MCALACIPVLCAFELCEPHPSMCMAVSPLTFAIAQCFFRSCVFHRTRMDRNARAQTCSLRRTAPFRRVIALSARANTRPRRFALRCAHVWSTVSFFVGARSHFIRSTFHCGSLGNEFIFLHLRISYLPVLFVRSTKANIQMRFLAILQARSASQYFHTLALCFWSALLSLETQIIANQTPRCTATVTKSFRVRVCIATF